MSASTVPVRGDAVAASAGDSAAPAGSPGDTPVASLVFSAGRAGGFSLVQPHSERATTAATAAIGSRVR
jgi:hypothetical protein